MIESSSVFLSVFQDRDKTILRLMDEKSIRGIETRLENETDFRCSPIFPIKPGTGCIPIESEPYNLGFFYFEDVCSVIAKILGEQKADQYGSLWFSHGLASLIVFEQGKENSNLIKGIQRNHADKLRAFEQWNIASGVLEVTEKWVAPAVKIEPPVPIIIDYTELPADIQIILNELVGTLGVILNRASQYIPSQIESFRRLASTVNDIVSELIFLNDPSKTTPRSFSEEAATLIRSDPPQLQKKILQRTGDLVQIAASLTAVLSHGFTGIVPILESRCFIQSYSLLGIGMAYCAISAFSGFVEDVFQEFPIDSVIKKEYPKPGPVEIFPNIRGYDPAEWKRDINHCVDRYLKDDQDQSSGSTEISQDLKTKSNLVYFSSRIGFRESTYSITAPLLLLTLGDEACWSPMTLSHELLHAHVHDIIAAVFADQERRLPEYAFKAIWERFKEDLKKQAQSPRHFIDSTRSIILNYCVKRVPAIKMAEKAANPAITIVKEGENKVRVPFSLPNGNKPLEYFSAAFREINEIIVQVLDYHYFYECNDDLYLGLLWESWSPVPAVLHDIEQYVLRSILAISSVKTGTVIERFKLSCENLKSVLKKICDRNPKNVVCVEALKLLNATPSLQALRIRFGLGEYLVDMTTCFFLSSRIHGALYKRDKNITKEDGAYHYMLETGEFRDTKIVSPVGFLVDRLQKSLAGEGADLPSEHRAAWVLMTCASALSPRR